MLITLHNQELSCSIDTLGAQMMSIQGRDGCEYLWQGDPKYWSDRAPTLFPFIGRLTDDSYCFHGKVYKMGIHGFAAMMEFDRKEQSEDRLVLVLNSNLVTLVMYPFDFTLEITYQLRGACLEITYCVRNKDRVTMPFAIGGHPGFRVPLDHGERFEDYVLEFSQICRPDRLGFTPAVYLSGHDEAFALKEGKILPLKHELFDDDAVILKNMDREVTLCSTVSGRSVTVRYPNMPYLGIWHWPKTDAPYVCIEPWTSLPSRQDVVEELSCKSDLIHILPGEIYRNTWSITISKGDRRT